MRFPISLFHFCCLAVLCSCGQIAANAQAPSLLTDNSEPVRASMRISKATAAPGDSFEVTVQARIAKGYHVYGSGGSNAPFVVTSVEMTLPKGLQSEGDWTVPKPVRAPDGAMIYTNSVQFRQTLKVKPDAPIKTLNLTADLHYQACNDKECFPPTSLELESALTILATNAAPALPR